MMSLYDLSVLTKTHGTKLFYDMLKQNKDIDYQNIPENGFKTKKEVDEWWKHKDVDTVIKIYDEYYGIENLINYYKK